MQKFLLNKNNRSMWAPFVRFKILIAFIIGTAFFLLSEPLLINGFERFGASGAVISLCLAIFLGIEIHSRRVTATDNYYLELKIIGLGILSVIIYWLLARLKPEIMDNLVIYITIVHMWFAVYIVNITDYYKNRHFKEKNPY